MPEIVVMGTKPMLEKALVGVPPGMIPDGIRGGDTKLIWSPDNAAEVESARRTFNDLRGKGFAAFRVKAKGEKGSQIHEFDPDAESIILTPPLRGG